MLTQVVVVEGEVLTLVVVVGTLGVMLVTVEVVVGTFGGAAQASDGY